MQGVTLTTELELGRTAAAAEQLLYSSPIHDFTFITKTATKIKPSLFFFPIIDPPAVV